MYLVTTAVIKDGSKRLVTYNTEYVAEAPFEFIVDASDLTVPLNEDFTLKANTKGDYKPAVLNLEMDGKPFRMKRAPDGSFTYTFRNVRNSLPFKLSADGFYSDTYTLEVLPTPSVVSFGIDLAYPKYLSKADQKLRNAGNFEIPEGTLVKWNFKTENAGKNWTKVEYSDPTDDYEGLGIGFWSIDTGWASGGTNTWQTYDGGDTWKEVEIDPSNKGDVINRFLRVGDVMYAAGVKIYKFNPNNVEDVNCTIGIKERPEIVEDNCTITCSPNPFAGSGQITYFVPEDGHVSIGITSIGGRLLELLVDEKQKAGTYTIAYNPKYNAKFVGCTILTGPYRANVKIIRPGGGNFATDY